MNRKFAISAALAGALTLAAPSVALANPNPGEFGQQSTSGGTSVPEPSMLVLFGAAALAVGIGRRRKNKV